MGIRNTYPGEPDLLVDLGELGELVPELVARGVPLRPEEEGEALVGSRLLKLLQLRQGLNLGQRLCLGCGRLA